MMLKTLRCIERPVVTVIVLLTVGIGGASAAGLGACNPQADEAGDSTVGAAASADPIRGHIERLSVHEAKQFYVGCSRSAMRGQLDSAETALCSIGYDVLLKRHFGGDFRALLAWSRSQAGDVGPAVGFGTD